MTSCIKLSIIWLFPAYAGVIPKVGEESFLAFSFPRIRGGDPFTGDKTGNLTIFSPHTRG